MKGDSALPKEHGSDASPNKVFLVGFTEKERGTLEALLGSLPKPPAVEVINHNLPAWLDNKALQQELKGGLTIVPSIVVRRSPEMFERLLALQPDTYVLVGGDPLDLELGPLKNKPCNVLKRPVTAEDLLSLFLEAREHSTESLQAPVVGDRQIPKVHAPQEATPESIDLLRKVYQSLDLKKAYAGALLALITLTKAGGGAVLEQVRGEQGWRMLCHDGIEPEEIHALQAVIRQVEESSRIKEPVLDQMHSIGKFSHLSLYPIPLMDEGLALIALLSEEPSGGSLPWIYADVIPALQNAWIFTSIQDKSFADPVTGVFNRRFLEIELPRELFRAKRHQRRVSILFAEADGMADLARNQGEDIVYRVLKETARRLSPDDGCIRNVDLLMKYGAYSFVIVLIESDYQSTLKVVAPRVLRVIREKSFLEGEGMSLSLTASVGIANFPITSWDWKLLLAAGEKALKEAQRAGGNMVVLAKESSA
jgi:diguanylate cyclase (GGDEF)-like protein